MHRSHRLYRPYSCLHFTKRNQSATSGLGTPGPPPPAPRRASPQPLSKLMRIESLDPCPPPPSLFPLSRQLLVARPQVRRRARGRHLGAWLLDRLGLLVRRPGRPDALRREPEGGKAPADGMRERERERKRDAGASAASGFGVSTTKRRNRSTLAEGGHLDGHARYDRHGRARRRGGDRASCRSSDDGIARVRAAPPPRPVSLFPCHD